MFFYNKVLVRSFLCLAITDSYHAHVDSEMPKLRSAGFNRPHVTDHMYSSQILPLLV
jgi:hypothetical protein